MPILSFLYRTVLDALFPLSAAEKELFSFSPEEALRKLKPAPDFSGLAVALPDARSVFAYKDERVSKLIWHIKYKKSAAAIRIGGYALWYALTTTTGRGRVFSGRFGLSEGEGEPAATSAEVDGVSRKTLLPKPVVVVPIPITSRRRKERGYNQCELLIDEIERLEKISGERLFIFRKDILIRAHHAERQTLKGREERTHDAKDVFEVDGDMATNDLKNVPIVIIDDVITTGSTMNEAVQTMKKAGFSDVSVLSLAH